MTNLLLSSGGSSSSSFFIGLIITLFMVFSFWALLLKANRSGWGIVIPIYGEYLLADIGCSMPLLWTILLLIPGINLISYCVIMYKLGRAFDQSVLISILLIIFPVIFVPYLAFGSPQYRGSYF